MDAPFIMDTGWPAPGTRWKQSSELDSLATREHADDLRAGDLQRNGHR
jgi:hypothetical protein